MSGSVFNMLMGKSEGPAPEVGMGATILYYTDRVAGTIIKVTPCRVWVQEDKAIRVGPNEMSDQQEYTYERNEKGRIKMFCKSKSGWKNGSLRLLIGDRIHYYDYSF
jgi:hypothetical protein